MKKMNRKNLKNVLLSFAVIGFGVSLAGAGNSVLAKANENENNETLTATDYLQEAEMVKGASIRLGARTGIRFGFVMDEKAYADFTDSYDAKFGVLIAPNDYKTKYGAFSEATVFGNGAEENNPKVYDWAVEQADGSYVYEDKGYTRVINLIYNQMTEYEDDEMYQDKMICYGSILDVKSENLSREFMSIGYIEYTPKAGGETEYYFLTENENSRSMTHVAQLRIADPESDSTEEADLYQKYIKPVESKASSYTVESYVVGKEIPFNTTVVNNVTINQAVTVTPATFGGYEFDAENALNSPTAVIVLANGKLTLKYYYTQKVVAPLEVAQDGTISFENWGNEFSYDLYLDGVLAKEDVVSGATNVYTDNVIKATGVYNVELVVLANGEVFARSEAVSVKTGFMNENEIYSFDNHPEVPTNFHDTAVTKELQSAITHNDSAYALKVTSASSGSKRLTFDLEGRPLEKNARVSYWIYVEKPVGVDAESTSTRLNVPNYYEGTLSKYCRTYSEAGTTTVPYGTWTKMYTYLHGNTTRLDLLSFAWDAPVENYVFYLDDICVEEMDYETGDGIYNVVMTSEYGGYFTFTSEHYGTGYNVGDEFDVTMKIKSSTTTIPGNDWGFHTVKAGGTDKTISSKSAYTMDWREVSFRVAITAGQSLNSGNMKTQEGISLVWLNECLPMGYITMKDVTFTPAPSVTADITLKANAVSGGAGPGAVTMIMPVDDSIPTGTAVKVTMSVALSAGGNYTRVQSVKQNDSGALEQNIVYGFAHGNASSYNSEIEKLKSGAYVTFSFDTIVVENPSYTYEGVSIPTTGKGIALLFISMKAAGDTVWIKDVSVDYALKAIANSGGAGPYVAKHFEVDDSIAVGTKVKVTATIAVTASSDKNYMSVITVNPRADGTFGYYRVYGYANEIGGNATAELAVLKSGEYVTITYEAVVLENYSYDCYGAIYASTGKGVPFGVISIGDNATVYLRNVSITVA